MIYVYYLILCFAAYICDTDPYNIDSEAFQSRFQWTIYIYIIVFLCFIFWCLFKKIRKEPITVPFKQRNFTNMLLPLGKGRISRLEYWLSWIAGVVIPLLLSLILDACNYSYWDVCENFMDAVILLCIYFILIQSVKRCHDINHNGWWILIPFYDLFLLFSDGDAFENKYGPDPKGREMLSDNA